MKNHLKSITSPKTWKILRKSNVFIARPTPGTHSLSMGMPLVVILRDILHLALTSTEVKKILNNQEILIDGKRQKDHRFMVGLFDVLSIPKMKKHYRIVLDQKGRLIVKEINEKESSIKPCKIVGKSVLPKGKIQFNLYDGKNIISDKKASVGDSFVLSLPSLDIKEVLPLEEKKQVFLISGKHSGDLGVLKEIKGSLAVYVTDGEEVETARKYLFVVGDGKNTVVDLKNKE